MISLLRFLLDGMTLKLGFIRLEKERCFKKAKKDEEGKELDPQDAADRIAKERKEKGNKDSQQLKLQAGVLLKVNQYYLKGLKKAWKE